LAQVEAVVDPPTLLASLDQVSLLQDLEVKGELGLGNLDAIAEVTDTHFLVPQQVHHLQAGGVRQGFKAWQHQG
jgi:uncharacterized protein YlxW (UPF0749 family)